MPATADRTGFLLHEFRTVTASDTLVKDSYGEDARDTGDEPVETFFDTTDDAQVLCDERLRLLKRDRRRFRQEVRSLVSFDGDLDFSQVTPAVRVIDDVRDADMSAAIVEITQDFAAGTTVITSWGVAYGSGSLSIMFDFITINGESVEMV